MRTSIKLLGILILLVSSPFEGIAVEPVYDRYSVDIICLKKVPIIKVQLNGETAYFILDSGSDVSLLNTEEASHFDFSLSNRAPKGIKGFSGERQAVHKVSEANVQLNDYKLQVEFYATDLTHLVKSLLARTEIKVTGIIGMDLMRAYGFEIDYGNKILHLDLNA